ncbi:helix-turn-helix transcriptional regulator [Sporosarcina sp. resist]|uniref:helix-turn-helix domain-containing protein n=1 Tax=Sporosarcina sp. resist TaxID=2762563 RepID=UPI00164E19F5|nr:helix-turn-helix transcriptional regulator [Sporosarcina sp. resist]QNK89396.1 helix-turn-helix transcriptional regulator [Sporosarcina sp. resist]
MFSGRLKQLRKNKKLTQEDMARYLGITRQGYAKYENDNSEPSLAMLVKIADMFAIPLDDLLGRTMEASEPVDEKSSTHSRLGISKDDYNQLTSYQHAVLDWAVSQEDFHFKNQSDNVLDMMERLEIIYEYEMAKKKQ